MITPRVFRRIIFTEPGVVTCAAGESPLSITKSTEIIVRNHFSAISVGTELACLSGIEPWFRLPGTPGYAAAGEVVACGESVTKVTPGDMVLTHGPHAEYFKIDTIDRYTGTCIKIPSGLSLRVAPIARMTSISLAAIRLSELELGDYVVVAGLGLVGNLAAQLAACQGAFTIGVDISAARRAAAADCGVAHTIDSSHADWKDLVRDIAGRRGITTFIDATGLSTVIADGSTLVGTNGEVILLGTPRASCQHDLTSVFRGIHLPPYATYRGALEWRFPTFVEEFSKHSIERNTEIILQLAATQRINFERLVTKYLIPEQAPQAYTSLRTKHDEYLGVVFDWIS